MSQIADIKRAADEEAERVPEQDRERVRADYIGAAMADSMFCQSCGARGYMDACPRCARCE